MFATTEHINLSVEPKDIGKIIFWDSGKMVCVLEKEEEINDFINYIMLLDVTRKEPLFFSERLSHDVECYIIDKNDKAIKSIWSRTGFLQVYEAGKERESSYYVIQTFEYLILKKEPIIKYLKLRGHTGDG